MLHRPLPGRDDSEPSADALLTALDDEDCRAFLRALDEPRTAAELCERCDVPSSTAYRKLDRLTDAGLVESVLQIRADGNHCARYRRTVNAITFELRDGNVVFDAD